MLLLSPCNDANPRRVQCEANGIDFKEELSPLKVSKAKCTISSSNRAKRHSTSSKRVHKRGDASRESDRTEMRMRVVKFRGRR